MNSIPTKILRYSFTLLFLWFGWQQIIGPANWVGFLPGWTGYLPIPGTMLVQLNGWFEIIAALFLAAGVFTRVVAAILALHLFGIAITAGGPIGMRDFILGMIGAALAFGKSDNWTLDFKNASEAVNPPLSADAK